MAWTDSYLPGSWRGVPFFLKAHDLAGGRRIASHEYALRDTPSTEDMGRRQRVYQLRLYVIADLVTQNYFTLRDTLIAALETSGVGTLVHPYLGPLRVRNSPYKMAEDNERAGMASFEVTFVESGSTPLPYSNKDTASAALAGLQSALAQVMEAYAIASVIADRPGILFGMASLALGSLVGNLAGLPPSITATLGPQLEEITASLTVGPAPVTSSITGLTGDPIAIAVTDAFSVAATAVVALQQPAVTVPDPVLGQASTATAMATDPTRGVGAFANWGAALAPPAGLQVGVQQQVQQAIINLVQAAATLAVVQIYAGTTWSTANAAANAKTLLQGYLNNCLAAAAATGSDALFQAWQALATLAITDLSARAQALPSLVAYQTTNRVPAVVLAQILYQDATQADLLLALNGTIHAGFMPRIGVALSRLPSQGAA